MFEISRCVCSVKLVVDEYFFREKISVEVRCEVMCLLDSASRFSSLRARLDDVIRNDLSNLWHKHFSNQRGSFKLTAG